MNARATITPEQEEQLQLLAQLTRDQPPGGVARIEAMQTALTLAETRDGNIACGRRLMALWRAHRAEEPMSERFIVVETDQPYQSWMVEDTTSRFPNNSDGHEGEMIPCYLQQFNDRTDARRLADHLNLRDAQQPRRSPWELFDPTFPKP